MTERKSEYDRILQKAVDTGLEFAGRNCRIVIYSFLERKFQTRLDEIPANIESLHKALEGIFGNVSTMIIEKIIARNLYERLGLRFEPRNSWTLVDYVNNTRDNVSWNVANNV